jgi:hypothetical protein
MPEQLRKILRKRQLGPYIPWEKTALDDAIRTGKFPPPSFYMSARTPVWFEEVVVEWQANAQRGSAAAAMEARRSAAVAREAKAKKKKKRKVRRTAAAAAAAAVAAE